ncbi:ATP-dependent protease La [Tolumonas auensis DSM 9187]|uniref:Lon protease n=1 Tax=Tolumonas auensis (strain DSM 9187 / NBRC 110442 / TA 4) TaxID=595494 RepID=C4LCW0_TOLAT|nr:endopeptidase La [Tolumonas auensis]ACQ92674.1 ATP-dependent protease La [Tolumonas auensis DSM 9187]
MSNEQENSTFEENAKTGLILAGQERPAQLHIIPIQGRPFLPAQILPVQIQANPWGKTIERVARTTHKMVALFRIADDISDAIPLKGIVPKTGCAVRILQASSGEGEIQFVAEGVQRVEIVSWLTDKPPYLVEVKYMENDKEESDTELKAYAMALIGALKELLPINPLYSEELKQYMNRFSPNDPSPLADLAAAITSASPEELQEVLDTSGLIPRMKKSLAILKKEIEVAKLQTKIREEVNKTISERQREFFLHEQLKVIQKELGMEKDDKTAEVDSFQARMKDKKVPEIVQGRFNEELKKLRILETGSPEYAVTRNYLDWISQVPWGVEKQQSIDLKRARKILDKDHDGLDDVKDRIIEFLAVGAYKKAISGAIMLLVGPPGVGKTSIGRSIANSLDLPFFRFSVGGMRDEAEIKGHRRTYIGAMPGKIVQALKECQVMNPVIMLDEIDKLGISHQGDPASALLETLDPEQNINFLDHYLDLRLDLSKCLFICTANTLDSIPAPLLDRMDTIRLSGYLADEKMAIARHHLWPRQLERAGVPKDKLKITDGAIRTIIEGYAREAGVRNLEKQLAKIVRKSVVELLNEGDKNISVKASSLEHYLGSPQFRKEKNLSGVGIVTGLAWTSLGGATLPIEASVIHQQGRSFKLTGQLGDVMKESAELAYSFVSSHLHELNARAEFYDKAAVHLHVPEGATPKDGPSAGVTMASALLSLALNRAPLKGFAMTGELTLTGHVLAIGGVREKVIAAKRLGIHQIIVPEANRGDVDELPEYVKEGVNFHFASHFRDIAKLLFPSL